jgi:hypothetical protein
MTGNPSSRIWKSRRCVFDKSIQSGGPDSSFNLKQKTWVPGPGQYEIQSDFGGV